MHAQKLLICELQFLEFIASNILSVVSRVCTDKRSYVHEVSKCTVKSVHPSVVFYKCLRVHIYKYIYIYIRLCKVKLGREAALH